LSSAVRLDLKTKGGRKRGYVTLAPCMAYPSGAESNHELAPFVREWPPSAQARLAQGRRTYWRRQAGSEHLNRVLPLEGLRRRVQRPILPAVCLSDAACLKATYVSDVLGQRIGEVQCSVSAGLPTDTDQCECECLSLHDGWRRWAQSPAQRQVRGETFWPRRVQWMCRPNIDSQR
jgi:hypothetical protein